MISGLLHSIGLGGSIVTAAMLILGVLYVRKAVKAGSIAAGFASMTAMYAMAVLAFAAIAIALGWVDPHPGVLWGHLTAGASWLWNAVIMGPLRMIVSGVVEFLSNL